MGLGHLKLVKHLAFIPSGEPTSAHKKSGTLLKKCLLNSWDFYLQTGIFQTWQGEPQCRRPRMLKISTHLLLETDHTESATTLKWQPRVGSVTDLGPLLDIRVSQGKPEPKANQTSALQPKANGISNSPTTSNTFLKAW